MPENTPEHGQHQLSPAVDPMWRWGAIGLAIVVGIAYLLAARLSLVLLTTPGGVAVFWPASGVAAGALIALGRRAQLPVAVGAMIGTIAAALLGGRNLTGSLINALCNAAEALITAGLIERYFGPRFSLDSLRQVLVLIAATIVGTAVSGVGGTLGFTYLRGSTAPLLTTWQHWFLSDALGILTVAPLLIGLASAARAVPSRREFTEGLVALAVLAVMSGLVVFLPREPWVTVVPIALLFPVLLWLAARCQPVFAAAGAFIIALTIVWTTTFGIGIFGDLGLPIADRILLAQASILAVSLCAIVLAALFAERRQHAATLMESEKTLRELNETLEQRVEAEIRERLQIWNVSQDLLVVADLEGRYLSVNPAWTVSLGWSEHDLLGKTSQWLLHPDDRERTLAEIGHLAAGRRTLHFENRFRHKDGSYRWLSWKAVPDQGRIYAMARDVTELRQTEEALRQVQRDLARVGRQTSLATTTASIAHEMAQPLATIVCNGEAALQWLNREKPDLDEVRSVLEEIVNDSHRANDVITSIRGMFRKDTQKKASIDINDLLRQTLALAHGEIENQRVTLELELLESLPQVTAERVPLQQVVLNLVTNAIEAMSEVKDRGRVLSIRTQKLQSRDVLITVADAGIGLDPKIIERIFEPFFTTKEQGMGMGLSICRSIVENQGGRLWASPGSPHGAIFHIQLPTEGPID